MNVDIYRVLALIGLVLFVNWLCWRSEDAENLHPIVRIGIQVGCVALSGLALARMLKVI